MSDDKNLAVKEKLAFLMVEIERASKKIGVLIASHNDPEDIKALAKLNDRTALYAQDIAIMLMEEREFDIPSIIEFFDLVEHFVEQIDSI